MRAFLVCAALTACWSGSRQEAAAPQPIENSSPPPPVVSSVRSPPPRRTPNEEALDRMRELESALCACQDMTCVQRVSEDMTQWSQELSQRGEQLKLTDEETKQATEIGMRMGECMQRAMANP